MTNVRDDGNIGIESMRNHLCTSETNFFLDAIDDMEGEVEIFFVELEESCNLRDHKSTGSIVEGPTDEVTIIEHHKWIWIGHDRPDYDAHTFYFFFAQCTDIYKE